MPDPVISTNVSSDGQTLQVTSQTDFRGCKPTGFLISIKGYTKWSETWEKLNPITQYESKNLSLFVHDMTPATEYEINVQTLNDKGSGTTVTLSHTTDDGGKLNEYEMS